MFNSILKHLRKQYLQDRKEILFSNNVIIFNGKRLFTEQDLPKGLTIIFKDNCTSSFVSVSRQKKLNLSLEITSRCTFEIDSNNDIRGQLSVRMTAEGSVCRIGQNNYIGALSILMIDEPDLSLSIGSDSFIGWGVSIRNSDGHTLFDVVTGEPLNLPSNIVIGNHVWIGRNVDFLKGANLPNNSIVGMGSIVTKKFTEEYNVYAGRPARKIRGLIGPL